MSIGPVSLGRIWLAFRTESDPDFVHSAHPRRVTTGSVDLPAPRRGCAAMPLGSDRDRRHRSTRKARDGRPSSRPGSPRWSGNFSPSIRTSIPTARSPSCDGPSTADSTTPIRCTSTTPAAGCTPPARSTPTPNCCARRVLGNPHSNNPTSLATTELVERARRSVLDYFNAPADEYLCVFTANASAALRLVGEAYPFDARRHLRPDLRQPQLGQRHPRVRPPQGRRRSPTCRWSPPICGSTARR